MVTCLPPSRHRRPRCGYAWPLVDSRAAAPAAEVVRLPGARRCMSASRTSAATAAIRAMAQVRVADAAGSHAPTWRRGDGEADCGAKVGSQQSQSPGDTG